MIDGRNPFATVRVAHLRAGDVLIGVCRRPTIVKVGDPDPFGWCAVKVKVGDTIESVAFRYDERFSIRRDDDGH